MSSFKNFTGKVVKSLALMSLVMAFAGSALATPSTAAANDNDICYQGMHPIECGVLEIRPYDAMTGNALYGAGVWARDDNGNEVKLYEVAEGVYQARVLPGTWKFYVATSGYETAEGSADVAEGTQVQEKVAVMANTRDSDSRVRSSGSTATN
jgi:hypothetical protein